MSYRSTLGLGAVPTDSNYDAATGTVMAVDLSTGINRRVPLAQATPVTCSLINGTQNFPYSIAQCGGSDVLAINYVTGAAPNSASSGGVSTQTGGAAAGATVQTGGASPATGSTVAPGGVSDFFSAALSWIQANPLLAAGIAGGVLLLVKR